MSSRRTLILLIAVGLGLLAAFFLYNYVNGVKDDVLEDTETVQILKASETIPQDTLGEAAIDASLVETGDIPRNFKPEGAVTNADQIRGKVALFDIPAGLPITEDMFVSVEDSQVSFRRRLENDSWVTATISVDAVGGVAGLLVPGDEVNIMALVEIDDETFDALPEQPPPDQLTIKLNNRYEMLYQNVHILAIGTLTQRLPGETVEEPVEGEEEPDTGDPNLITFNVPAEAAQWIASFAANASLYLSLVPEGYEPAVVEPLPNFIETLPGQDPDVLTPYGGPDEDGAE